MDLELSAPGKIILFGEHSVVYGKRAIAATLGLYTNLRLTLNNSGFVSLQFPSIDLNETFSVDSIKKYFLINDNLSEGDRILATINRFEQFYTLHGTKTLTESHRFSLTTFFQCLSYFTEAFPGFNLHVDTDLTVGSGAGSSASFSVTVATALLLLELALCNKLDHYIIRNADGGCISITDELMNLISERALSCEKIFHGNPSGIDHNVILHGSVLGFIKCDNGNEITPIHGGSFKVLLVDTKVEKNTKRQVEMVKKLNNQYPDIIECVLDAMGNVANKAIEILSNLKQEPNELAKNESKLADLIDLNQNLLRCIRTSHHSLDKICSIAKMYGLSAKLTGGGGGGFAFIYIPHDTSAKLLNDLRQELECSNFLVTEVILGGPGLRITSLSMVE